MKSSRLDFKSCSLTSDVEELSLFYPSSLADCNTLPSPAGSAANATLTDRQPRIWHLKHLMVPSATRHSLSQIHEMASPSVHVKTPLPYALFQQLAFLNGRGRFHNLFVFFLTLKLELCGRYKLSCLLGIELAPSLNYICVSFVVFVVRMRLTPQAFSFHKLQIQLPESTTSFIPFFLIIQHKPGGSSI